jgi:cell division protein FtsZ
MNTIKAFTAEDAMVIVGTVIDETMEDRLRVTMVATGLGGGATKARQPRLEVVEQVIERTGTDGLGTTAGAVDYDHLERTPAVIRRGRTPASPGTPATGFDPSDIPAFLRKQAD